MTTTATSTTQYIYTVSYTSKSRRTTKSISVVATDTNALSIALFDLLGSAYSSAKIIQVRDLEGAILYEA